GEKEPLARDGLGADVTGVTLTQPALRQGVYTKDLQTRISSSDAAEDFAGAVRRAVINRDHFYLDTFLRQQAVGGRVDTLFLVAGGDHDRDSWPWNGPWIAPWRQRSQ